jgi:hypothetical protein
MDAWLDRLRNEIEETTLGLRESDWGFAPQGRWNSAQIMEHLGRSYGTTAKMLELSMDAGAPEVRAVKFSELWKKLLVVDLGMFPSGAKAPAMVTPQGDPGPVALERALSNLERMDVAITEAEKRWGSEKPIAMHVVLGPLKPCEWRKFHYVHGHHHLVHMRKRLENKVVR